MANPIKYDIAGETFYVLPTTKNVPYVVHVDGDVLKRFREEPNLKGTLPIIRIAIVDHHNRVKQTYVADWINIHGSSWMETNWQQPLSDRPMSVCVIRTYAQLTYGTGTSVLTGVMY